MSVQKYTCKYFIGLSKILKTVLFITTTEFPKLCYIIYYPGEDKTRSNPGLIYTIFQSTWILQIIGKIP